MRADELFSNVAYLLGEEEGQGVSRNRVMHETLVLVCKEGLQDTHHAFGDLNAQVETLIRQHDIPTKEANAIRRMRRHSNQSAPLAAEDRHYDALALAQLVSRVFGQPIPANLTAMLPWHGEPQPAKAVANAPDKRCIVLSWDHEVIRVVVDEEQPDTTMTVRYTEATQYARMDYLHDILREGMHLNLLGCHVAGKVITPRLIIVEPDSLMDISTIAGCFEDYGHHPLLYLVSRMKPKANSQAILLGNFAGNALDDIINNPDFDERQTLVNNFKEKAMEYSTCADFDPVTFKQQAASQVSNLRQIVEELGQRAHLDKAILEPSFICERLGIQGRVDLMTTDLKLLAEQKSGRNMFLERNIPNAHGSRVVEKHYVQVLLYYGILYYNFHLQNTDIRLIYSKYPLPDGLIELTNLLKLTYEAIRFRNEAVAMEFDIAANGMEHVLPELTASNLNVARQTGYFYDNYLRPQLDKLLTPLQQLAPIERKYFCRMMQFSIRENLLGKVGVVEGTGNSLANLWNMPLVTKRETGNIFTGLTIINKEKSTGEDGYNGYDLITLAVPRYEEDFLPNFRRGDMVLLYAYPEDEEPDVRKALLFKGALADIQPDRITVKLNDGQQNPDIFNHLPYDIYLPANGKKGKGKREFVWCVEHGSSDVGGTAAIGSLYEFATSTADRKALLLGQRAPRADKSVTLTRGYDPVLDPILLKAKQAQDYFLLVGPPGTGKTSRALRFLVEETLASKQQGGEEGILLLSYTNRAVDEICAMLVDAGIDFIRLGNELSCAPQYEPYLVAKAMGERPTLAHMKQRLTEAPVILATTSMLQSKPFILSLRRFGLAIVDESSQILEPGIIGLLASHRQDNDNPADMRCDIDKFILIGDHKQLPAVVQQNDLDAAIDDPDLQAIGLTSGKNSLFERLIRQEQAAQRDDFMAVLNRQGRMHPEIADFPNTAFYADEQLQPVPLPHQLEGSLSYTEPSQDALDDTLKRHRMLFIPSADCLRPDISDKVNTDEARIVATLLQRIQRFYGKDFDADKTVGVIVPYRNQIAMIRQEIARMGIDRLEGISIDTVERFQGSQRDVIIYSFTVQQQYQLDFLTANSFDDGTRVIDRKLNVALTRARKQLIITGNPRVLSANPVFDQLMTYIRQRNGFANV